MPLTLPQLERYMRSAADMPWEKAAAPVGRVGGADRGGRRSRDCKEGGVGQGSQRTRKELP